MSFFHQVTALPYTNCQRCNLTENLYIVTPAIPQSDVGGFICPNCLGELAEFAGYIKAEAHASVIKDLNDLIVEQNHQIKEIPKLLEKVIDGANNLLADFVLSAASIIGADNPVQPKSNKADTSGVEHNAGSTKAKRGKYEQDNLSSLKPAE